MDYTYPSFDERVDNPERQATLNPPLLHEDVSPQTIILLRWVCWGCALLAVALTGWLVFWPEARP